MFTARTIDRLTGRQHPGWQSFVRQPAGPHRPGRRWTSRIARSLALLPLAVAIAAGLQFASVACAVVLLLAGGLAAVASYRVAGGCTGVGLCSWKQVERGLNREARRARRRRWLYGAGAPLNDDEWE